MAGSLKIRELLTRWAFRADTKKVDEFNKGIASAKALTKAAGRSLRGMARGANWVARRLLVVGGAIAGAGALAVKAAADAEESESKFAAVFGKNAANLTKWSDDYAKAAQRNRFELREQASTFGALFDAMEFTGDQTANLSKRLTQLTVDVASFHDEAESDVLIALRSGLLGNVEPVIKYGANVQVARVNQELLNMGIRGGVKAANDQQKMLARLNIILRATSKGHGDAVKTSGSFKNRMRGLKAEIKDFLIVAGTPLLKMLAPVVKKITDAVKGIKEWVVANKVLIRQRLDAFVERVADFLKSIDWRSVGRNLWNIAKAAGKVALFFGRIFGDGDRLKKVLYAIGAVALAVTLGKVAAAVHAIGTAAFFVSKGLMAAMGTAAGLSAALMGVAVLFALVIKKQIEAQEAWMGLSKTIKEERAKWGEAPKLILPAMRELAAAPAAVRGAAPPPSYLQRPEGMATRKEVHNNINAPISITVPPGTPAEQIRQVGKAAERGIRNANRETMPDIVR